jgi:hypothetical protein
MRLLLAAHRMLNPLDVGIAHCNTKVRWSRDTGEVRLYSSRLNANVETPEVFIMEKLTQLLTANASDFTVTFGAATGGFIAEIQPPECPVWLEAWVVPARAGYVLGDGEFIHEGQPQRFHFSGLPLRHCQETRLSGTGTISRLGALRDFSEVYLPCDTDAAQRAGSSVTILENEKGVVLRFIASDEDRIIDLPFGGLRVRLATEL